MKNAAPSRAASRIRRTAAMLCAVVASAVVPPAASEDTQVPFPEGYRDWYHVKSMVINEGHAFYSAFGGIHHIYANGKAIEGYRSGAFPDGAVIVFDLIEAEHADNAVTEGARKVAGVMHKDTARFSATGGWGFEAFAGGDPDQRTVGGNADSACYACHAPKKDSDYVFSQLRG